MKQIDQSRIRRGHNRGEATMDTNEAAARLGTTPRQFRIFLRSPMSTFVAVGSGARYSFTESDLVTLATRFEAWRGAGKPKPPPTTPRAPRRTRTVDPAKRDSEVWEEEGPVIMEDIRDPRVRARVKANARRAEDELMMLLLAKGLHVIQKGDKVK